MPEKAEKIWKQIKDNAVTAARDIPKFCKTLIKSGTAGQLLPELLKLIMEYYTAEELNELIPLKSLLQIAVAPELRDKLDRQEARIARYVFDHETFIGTDHVRMRQFQHRFLRFDGRQWSDLEWRWNNGGFIFKFSKHLLRARCAPLQQDASRDCCFHSDAGSNAIVNEDFMWPQYYHLDAEQSDHPLHPDLPAAQRADFKVLTYTKKNLPSPTTAPKKFRDFILQQIDAFAFDIYRRKAMSPDDGPIAHYAHQWSCARCNTTWTREYAKIATFLQHPESFIAADKEENPQTAQFWLTETATASSLPTQSEAGH